jgi:hypothetical protein
VDLAEVVVIIQAVEVEILLQLAHLKEIVAVLEHLQVQDTITELEVVVLAQLAQMVQQDQKLAVMVVMEAQALSVELLLPMQVVEVEHHIMQEHMALVVAAAVVLVVALQVLAQPTQVVAVVQVSTIQPQVLAAVALSSFAGKIHRQMQILRSLLHPQHGLLQQVQHQLNILSLLVVAVQVGVHLEVLVLVDLEQVLAIQ